MAETRSDNPRAPSTQSPPALTPAWTSRRAWIILLIVVAVGTTFDLVTKRVAFERIAEHPVEIDRETVLTLSPEQIGRLTPQHEPVVVIPHVLQFELVLNPGAVFGVGSGRRVFFVAFTFAALVFGGWVFARWTRADQWAAHVSIGLILAGGLGNLYDRIVFGCVRDFLHPLPTAPLPFGLTWPGGSEHLWPWVSNVADAFLLIGIAGLVITLWRDPFAQPEEIAPSGDEDAADSSRSTG